jgi:AraC-like DNA-binding protein
VEFREHALDWHQLAYASRGVLTVHTPPGTWVVPPHRAVWIPAGARHRIEAGPGVSVRTLYFAKRTPSASLRECRAVNITPLLRELVLQAIRVGVLHAGVASEARLARVILDQLETLPTVPLQLPRPADPRGRIAAELLERGMGEPSPLEDAARRAGASRRTLERIFERETHMTLGRWHQRARLIEALRRLAAGHAVTRVAMDVGYSTPSAFIFAFRREMGTTPRRYFGDEPAPARIRRRASHR